MELFYSIYATGGVLTCLWILPFIAHLLESYLNEYVDIFVNVFGTIGLAIIFVCSLIFCWM
jgi:hypothetical protein